VDYSEYMSESIFDIVVRDKRNISGNSQVFVIKDSFNLDFKGRPFMDVLRKVDQNSLVYYDPTSLRNLFNTNPPDLSFEKGRVLKKLIPVPLGPGEEYPFFLPMDSAFWKASTYCRSMDYQLYFVIDLPISTRKSFKDKNYSNLILRSDTVNFVPRK
jgi:hypothetical protein